MKIHDVVLIFDYNYWARNNTTHRQIFHEVHCAAPSYTSWMRNIVGAHNAKKASGPMS